MSPRETKAQSVAHPPNNTKPKALILAILAGVITCSMARVTLAQDPIRVETNQVLIPLFVTDKERDRLLRKDPSSLWRAIKEGNIRLQDDILESTMIRGLTAGDFQVFEDGKEHAIQSVTYEPTVYYNFHDNRGYHSEYIGEGGGKWTSREWPPWLVGDGSPPHYVIAYARSDSPEGSCHQVTVKVNRRNAVVDARSEYCNIRHPASDPLNGTEFGKQIESNLASPKDAKVDISLLAMAFYTDSNEARVHIALDWPWKSLKSNSKMVGVLGIAFKKDGSPATRFSDVCQLNYMCQHNSTDENSTGPHWDHILTRYETQVNLPPGEYDLRVVLSDGTKFGRAEIPLVIESHDRKELAVSAVSLCKQIQNASAYSQNHAPKLPGSWTAKPPGDYVPLVSEDIEYKPTANTRFKKGETLYAYFQVYEPSLAGATPARVKIQFRVYDQKTGQLQSDSGPVSAERYVRAVNPVIPIGIGIDISKLLKGSYRLEVQATDSAGQSTLWKTANFTVE
jgi:hypothetical protein